MIRRFTVSSAIISLTLAAGCNPQNAEMLSGSYRAYLSETTSFSLSKGKVNLDPSKFDDFYNLDCRDLSDTPDVNDSGSNDDEIAAIRLENRMEVCDRTEFRLTHETWLDQGAYRVIGNSMEPWRAEALITGEGDFQLGFHQRVPGGGDFRFAFAIDPDFQPTFCGQNADGSGTELKNVDGDWLEGWSGDLAALAELPEDEVPEGLRWFRDHYSGGTLYFLNALSYQFDPNNTVNFWSLPNEWLAGHTVGKFVEEFVHGRTTRYGKPRAYTSYELDGGEPEAADLYYCGDDDRCTLQCNQINNDAQAIGRELAWAGPDGENPDAEGWFQPIAHCNSWRDPDLEGPGEPGLPDVFAPGLDGWGELHYNWVIIDAGSELTEGGSASGAFGLVYDGDESSSRVFVQGEFNVDRIKRDRWTTDDIEAIKLAQNNTQICGG